MSKKFELGSIAVKPEPKSKPLQHIGVLGKDEHQMDVIRKALNASLIDKLKKLYNSEKWKYKLIKNVKEYQKQDMQYAQLIQFEKGGSHHVNFMIIIMGEIARLDKSLDIQIFKDGVKIK
jgi:hypothetical protein